MSGFPGSVAPSQAAAWNLEPSASNRPLGNAIPADGGNGGGEESVIGEDERIRVSPQDIVDGGKFRSIVKIFSRFAGGANDEVVFMGTGWLIAPDLVVTAGHVVYNWNRKLGAASQITCYIGYSGRESVNTPGVQCRFGRSVVTTAEWISTRDNRSRDVAFLQLDRPFTGNLCLFSYTDTPQTFRGRLGVVGYPGDRMSRGEQGAEMYQVFDAINFDLETGDKHMIEHRMSTYNGQGGGPILRADRDKPVSIGCQTFSNLGTSIKGKYGIDYDSFISLLTGNKSGFGSPGSIKIIQASAAMKSNPMRGSTQGGSLVHGGSNLPSGFDLTHGFDTNRTYAPTTRQTRFSPDPPFLEEESFFDVLKSISRIGNNFAPSSSPLMGPLGGPASVTAGTIIQSAIRAEGVPDEVNPTRAILAEASLQAILGLEQTEELQDILDYMQKTWPSYKASDIAPIAKVAAPLLTESALEISVERPAIAENRSRQQNRRASQPRRPLKLQDPHALQDNAFVKGLLEPSHPLDNDEGFFDTLGSIFQKALSVAKPIVSQFASSAIKGVAQAIDGESNSARSGFRMQGLDDSNEAAELLFHRAAMADIALQALMKLSRDQLRELRVPHPEDGETDSIFDYIKTTVQQIGPVAISSAQKAGRKFVTTNRTPTHAASESSFSPRRSKPSLMDMLNSENHGPRQHW